MTDASPLCHTDSGARCLASESLAETCVFDMVDRNARKARKVPEKTTPSDHCPVLARYVRL